MSRLLTSDLQRQNINVRHELNDDIDKYLRWLEKTQENDVTDCLGRHEITPILRARMIDWMIEVLTNFRCDDQTFFIACSLQDRYFKFCEGQKRNQRPSCCRRHCYVHSFQIRRHLSTQDENCV